MRRGIVYSLTALFLPLVLFANGSFCCALEGSPVSTASPVPTPEPVIRPAEVTPTPLPSFTPEPEAAGLVLSEVCFDGGEKGDWIELYNRSEMPVSAAEYRLSDRDTDLNKYTLPEMAVLPGQRILVYASDCGFSLKAGETVYLTDTVRGSTESLLLPLRTGYTCGPEAGKTVLFRYATPWEENAPSYVTDAAIPDHDPDGLYISEVSATGDEEWIELCNGGDQPLELGYWTIRVGEDPSRIIRLGGTAEPGGFVIKEAELPASGTVLELFDPYGALRDTFYTGVLRSGMTSGRGENGERLFYLKGTPGKQNGSGSAGYASAVIPSETQLYHSEPFTLTLTAREGAVIRYTTNGSEPAEDSTLYEGPLTVDSSCVIRACAFEEGRLPGETLTLHFQFTEPHTMPVVCLSVPPKQWKKISTSDYKQDMVRVDAVWYETDGRIGVSFPADFVLHGEASRYYKQKSYTLHLRGAYGRDSVRYPFWDEEGADELSYSSFVLRSASQDQGVARMRDSFAQRAVEGLHIENAMTRPVILYVNGEYWGIYDFNECLNQDYLSTHYGAESETVNIIYRESIVKHGSLGQFNDLCAAAKAVAKNYTEENYLDLLEWMDEDYYTDYLIAQTFLGNYDTANQRFWDTSDLSLRWRPVFNDIDRCLVTGHTEDELFSSYFDPKGITLGIHKLHVNTDVFCALRNNPGWCRRFPERYAEVLCTVFSVERLEALCDEMAAELAPEMSRHISRWKTPASYEKWDKNVAALKKEIRLRHEEIQKQVKAEFGVSDAVWNGYIKKYGGEPVTVG